MNSAAPGEESDRDIDEFAERVATGSSLPDARADESRVMTNLRRLAKWRAIYADSLTAIADRADDDEDVPAAWGHLRVLDRLGAGGFGVVYRAFDPLLQREVALKLRRVARDDDASALAHIEEARRLARVRHPNVLAIHGAGIHDGRAGIWADLLDGETVQRGIERGRIFSRAEVADVATQLAGAMHAIHTAGLVHGDIKASNVMLEQQRVTLMDFGAALPVGEQPRVGSPACMAPEMLAGGQASHEADIYSLGALLHGMALAKPFERERLGESARALRQALGSALARLALSMLAQAPSDRPDASTVLACLNHIATQAQRRVRRTALALMLAGLSIGLAFSLVALRTMQIERNRARSTMDVVVSSAIDTAPQRQPGPASLSAFFENLATRANADLDGYPDARAELLLTSGHGLHDLGQRERGLELVETGLRLVEELSDYPELRRAEAYALVGMTRLTQHDPAGTVRDLQSALQHFERAPRGVPRTEGELRVRGALANVLGSRGDWRGAVQAHERILAQREALPEIPDATRAVDHYNLATYQYKLNRCKQARAHLAAARDLLARGGNGGSLRDAFVLHSAAQVEVCLGAPDVGLRYVEQARDIYRHEYPADHINLTRLLIVEAGALRAQGRSEEALARLAPLAMDSDNSLVGGLLLQARLHSEKSEWAQAHADATRARRGTVDTPLAPYVTAAETWFAFKEGHVDATAARGALDQAIQTMRAAGYDELREYAEIAAWRASLEAVAE